MDLAEAKAAVLARLRTRTELFAFELRDCVGPLLDDAVAELEQEGRIIVRDGDRLGLSTAQRELDELRESEKRGWGHAVDAIGARDSARLDAALWREIALSLPLATQSRENGAGASDDVRARPHAYSPELGRRLNLLARRLREEPVEALGADGREAYEVAISDASWIASYGRREPALATARVILRDGSGVRVAVLGFIPCRATSILVSSPATGRAQFGIDGTTPDWPGARLHPDDLAALRGEGSAALSSSQVEG